MKYSLSGDADDKYRVSKKAIIHWLENYPEMVMGSGHIGLPGTSHNSGPKSRDGITHRQINKIMLQAAFKDMPVLLRRCVYARWVKKLPLGETLRKLELTKDAYYKRCEWAIEFLELSINHYDLQKAQLMCRVNRILKEDD